MKPKNTLLLLLVAVGIFAFIWFYEKTTPDSTQAAQDAGKVVVFDRDEITEITIRNGANTIELHKDKEGAWLMEKPVRDRANMSAIHQLFTTAEGLKSEAVVSEDKGSTKDQIREFGLSSPDTRVTFTGGKKPVELLLGKDAAVEGRLYVRRADSEVVHVIGTDLKTQISKKPDEFRDPTLTQISTNQVNKVAIKTPTGEIELARDREQHWDVTKPLKARGNDQKVGDLISQVATAQVTAFAPDPANLTAYGLQEPQGSITLFTGEKDQPAVLQIGGPVEKEKDKVYAKLSTRDAVCVLPKTVADLLATKPNDLRDRFLLRVPLDIVDRMTIESPGKEKIVLARSGESWVRKVDGKDQLINASAANRLLSELGRQQVTTFVADVATELPKYGLDQPLEKITLSSYASENTPESKAGERPIVSILFGRADGDNVFTKLDDEPFVVTVPRALLEFAMDDPLQWQELGVFKFKPEDFTAISITRTGQPTLALTLGENGWALAKGDGKVNQINVQTIVNIVAKLRAARWIGARTPADGLDKPSVSVDFTVKGITGNQTLRIGAITNDNFHAAESDAVKGVFAISHPDFTAFELPLIDKPPATPVPATPPATPAAPETPANPATPAPPIPAVPN